MWPAQQKLKPGVPGEKSNDMCRETHRLSGFLFTDKRQNNFISQFGIFHSLVYLKGRVELRNLWGYQSLTSTLEVIKARSHFSKKCI